MLYPIFDRFEFESDGDDESGEGNHSSGSRPNVVAFLSIDIFWQAFLKDLLPPTTTDAIYVVISNSCQQVFTYQVLGDQVTFIGDGDRHQPSTYYDSLMKSTLFGAQLMTNRTDNVSDNANDGNLDDASSYKGVPLYGNFCPYTLNIYPSVEMENAYVNNAPIVYTATACLIFLFTSLVFVLYDCLVERRQRMTMESASRSDAIVASLFPSKVKQQMYDEHQQKKLREEREKKHQQQQEQADRKRHGPGLLVQKQESEIGVSERELAGASPIASVYPETSILFADLVRPYCYFFL